MPRPPATASHLGVRGGASELVAAAGAADRKSLSQPRAGLLLRGRWSAGGRVAASMAPELPLLPLRLSYACTLLGALATQGKPCPCLAASPAVPHPGMRLRGKGVVWGS